MTTEQLQAVVDRRGYLVLGSEHKQKLGMVVRNTISKIPVVTLAETDQADFEAQALWPVKPTWRYFYRVGAE